MSYGRGRKFWKGMREFDTKKEAERSADFKVETYKKYEFQTWTNEKGRLVLRAYKGESGKPVSYYYYRSEADRVEAVERMKKNADNREKVLDERKKARKNTVNPYEVGDILTSSWGYDQTNVDFYEVIGVTNKSVRLEKIGSKTVGDNGPGGLSVVPDTAWRGGRVFLKRVSSNGWVRLTSYSGASKWSGNPQYETHPMYGH
jgi:hypothetical protein